MNVILKNILKVMNYKILKISLLFFLLISSKGIGQKRIALFELADGTLKIVCDGEKSSITVSSHTN